MYKRIVAGPVLSLIALLTFPTGDAIADTICTGFFSVTPSVCGSASVSGHAFTATGPTQITQSTLNGLQQFSGAAVTVDSTGGGTGIGGSVNAAGSFGVAHVSASSFTDYASPTQSIVTPVGSVGFVDGFSLQSRTEVKFVSSGDGVFTGGGQAFVVFNLENLTQNSLVISDDRIFLTQQTGSTASITRDLFLDAGNYLFNWSMEADAQSGSDAFSTLASSTADLSNTGFYRRFE
jgi:hypothetical protein